MLVPGCAVVLPLLHFNENDWDASSSSAAILRSVWVQAPPSTEYESCAALLKREEHKKNDKGEPGTASTGCPYKEAGAEDPMR